MSNLRTVPSSTTYDSEEGCQTVLSVRPLGEGNTSANAAVWTSVQMWADSFPRLWVILRLGTADCFTMIRQGWQTAWVLGSFGAGEILQDSEDRRRGRQAPPEVPGTRAGSALCATPSGRQTRTKRRDVRLSPTCQSCRSVCCRLTQRKDSCSLTESRALSAFTSAQCFRKHDGYFSAPTRIHS